LRAVNLCCGCWMRMVEIRRSLHLGRQRFATCEWVAGCPWHPAARVGSNVNERILTGVRVKIRNKEHPCSRRGCQWPR
jgi:hypothetical protein